MVPVEAEERFDRAAGSVVCEEVIDRRTHAGPDVPGPGAGHRVVLGIHVLIRSHAHADHLGFKPEARGVLRAIVAYPIFEAKCVARFKRRGEAF